MAGDGDRRRCGWGGRSSGWFWDGHAAGGPGIRPGSCWYSHPWAPSDHAFSLSLSQCWGHATRALPTLEPAFHPTLFLHTGNRREGRHCVSSLLLYTPPPTHTECSSPSPAQRLWPRRGCNCGRATQSAPSLRQLTRRPMQAFLKNMVLPPPTPPTHTRIPLAQRPAMFRRCTTSDCPSGRVGKEAALTDAPLGGHRTGGPLRKGDQGAGPPALPLAPVRSSLLKSLHVESEGAVYQERPTHAIARRPQPVAPSTLLRARTRLPGAAITPAKRSELDYADAALSRGSVTQPQPMQYSTPFHANAHVWSHTPVVMVEAICLWHHGNHCQQ